MDLPSATCFYGGPHLLAFLSDLPPALVDAVFGRPIDPLLYPYPPTTLHDHGLATISSFVSFWLPKFFPALSARALDYLLHHATSSGFLAHLVSRWGLSKTSFDRAGVVPDREEDVFIRLVGAVHINLGQEIIENYFERVLGPEIWEFKAEIQEQGPEDVRRLLTDIEAHYVPPASPVLVPTPVAPARVAPDSARKAHNAGPPCPPADPRLLLDMLARLTPSTRETILTHPSLHRDSNYEVLGRRTPHGLRKIVKKLIVELRPHLGPQEPAHERLLDRFDAPEGLRMLTSRWDLASRVSKGDNDIVDESSFLRGLLGGIAVDLGRKESFAWGTELLRPVVESLLSDVPLTTAFYALACITNRLNLALTYQQTQEGYNATPGQLPRLWKEKVYVQGHAGVTGRGRSRVEAKETAAQAFLDSGVLAERAQAAGIKIKPATPRTVVSGSAPSPLGPSRVANGVVNASARNNRTSDCIHSYVHLVDQRARLLDLDLEYKPIISPGTFFSHHLVSVAVGTYHCAQGKGTTHEEATEAAAAALYLSGRLPEIHSRRRRPDFAPKRDFDLSNLPIPKPIDSREWTKGGTFRSRDMQSYSTAAGTKRPHSAIAADENNQEEERARVVRPRRYFEEGLVEPQAQVSSTHSSSYNLQVTRGIMPLHGPSPPAFLTGANRQILG